MLAPLYSRWISVREGSKIQSGAIQAQRPSFTLASQVGLPRHFAIPGLLQDHNNKQRRGSCYSFLLFLFLLLLGSINYWPSSYLNRLWRRQQGHYSFHGAGVGALFTRLQLRLDIADQESISSISITNDSPHNARLVLGPPLFCRS